jgi:S1-C subfamily serine protease
VTCDHVVRAARGAAVTVIAQEGGPLRADVVARDPEHDLALLRARGQGPRAAEVGDSTTLRVGDLVLAVGNPLGRVNAVTAGIVAARAPADPDLPVEPIEPDPAHGPGAAPGAGQDRPRRPGRGERPDPGAFQTPDLIQADIRLYPGNSGGPLADARGHVVGINSMVAGGLGLAIPGRIVQRFVRLALGGTGQRPHLGVRVLTVELPAAMRTKAGLNRSDAALIAEVEAESPAAQAGLLLGDILIGFDGRQVVGANELVYALAAGQPGEEHVVTFLRGGERRELRVRLGQAPAEAAA